MYEGHSGLTQTASPHSSHTLGSGQKRRKRNGEEETTLRSKVGEIPYCQPVSVSLIDLFNENFLLHQRLRSLKYSNRTRLGHEAPRKPKVTWEYYYKVLWQVKFLAIRTKCVRCRRLVLVNMAVKRVKRKQQMENKGC